MVDIYPFKALRPIPKHADDISDFICPPYDVISSEDRAALIAKAADNVVQVELPQGNAQERFKNAANLIERWKDEDHLQQDRRPSVYLLETTFKISDSFAPSSSLKRYGVLVALRLETPGKGAIRPHEKTLPKAKEERLNLLRATRTHISPIFGLFFDKRKEWSSWVAARIRKKPTVCAREHSNLSHRLWKVEDQTSIKKVRDLLRGKPLYIADGHHRYEVSWAYREEQLLSQPHHDPQAGWNYVMAYVCPIEEKGLLMLPTHRLVQSDKSFTEWKKHLEPMFNFEPMGSVKEIVTALSSKTKSQRILGWAHREGKFLLHLKPSFSIKLCLPHRVEALCDLDVVVLHDLVMEEASGKTYTKDKDLIYTRDIKQIQALTESNPSWTAFILASSGVESLAKVASAGEVMPPKTTYFYPKVPTGFTLMAVGQKIGR